MKKIILLLATITLMTACNKVLNKLTTFNITRTGEFTIPATSIVGQAILLSSQDIETSYAQEFENNGVSTENVEYIKITKMKVRIKTPASADFNFLKSVELTISADGLSEKVIASKNNIQNDYVNEMEIDVTGEDLKPYLMKDKFKLNTSSVLDEVIPQDYVIEATPTFEVKGNLLN